MRPLSYNHFIDLGEIRVPIIIKKLSRSRRFVIRYQPLKKHLSLTLPARTNIRQGLHFVSEKRDWILQQVQQYSNADSARSFHDGQVISVLGKNIRLTYIGGRGTVSEHGDILLIHGDSEFIARRVKQWIINKLKTEIISLAEYYSTQLKVKTGNITLRDTSSHWGSCSSNGNLSFSWRLAFAPHEVLKYVVAHEVTHIREHNHSKEFWALVAQIFPEYKTVKNWLKHNGKSLWHF